jgi:4-hydroxy-tetrahydrodipicolinate synthase
MIASLIVAVVTPFDASGAVDKGALQDYLALLSAAGVKAIFVNGTTGEFFNMTLHEHGAVLNFAASTGPDRSLPTLDRPRSAIDRSSGPRTTG